jgi:hypothetical protein
MWVWGKVTVKEFRAKSSGYSSIHGEIQMHSKCVEIRSGVTNTGKKLDTYLCVDVIQKIEFD